MEQLQQFIRKVKGNREMEERFMILEEMLRDERAEGRAEGQKEMLLGFLRDLGEIPQEVQEKISGENRLEVLTAWGKTVACSLIKYISMLFRQIFSKNAEEFYITDLTKIFIRLSLSYPNFFQKNY